MKYLRTYNESIRDAMKPKSKDDVMKSIEHMTPDEKLVAGFKKDIPWVVQLAFDEGVDIEALGEKNLSEACRKDQTELAKVLIKNGADIHQKNDYCIMIAIINNNVELTRLLFEKGADCKVKDWVRSQVRKYGTEEIKELVGNYMDGKTNESVRDMMKPKSREDMRKAVDDAKDKGNKNIEVVVYDEIIGKTIVRMGKKTVNYPPNLPHARSFISEGDELTFYFNDDSVYKMNTNEKNHGASYITLDDINGDFNDIIGEPLITAEEVSSRVQDGTWTFYKFATIKGYVDLRWFAEASQYYSEKVSFKKVPNKKFN